MTGNACLQEGHQEEEAPAEVLRDSCGRSRALEAIHMPLVTCMALSDDLKEGEWC
jgi:hypothetical protein